MLILFLSLDRIRVEICHIICNIICNIINAQIKEIHSRYKRGKHVGHSVTLKLLGKC